MRSLCVSLLVMVLVAGAGCEDTSRCHGTNCTDGGTGGGSGTGACDATNCNGCCDAQGQCQAGTTQTQCGNEGHACDICYHSSCNGVYCVPAPDGGGTGGGGGTTTGGGSGTGACDATNCNGCCDAQGQCQAGTTQTQCGNEGHACDICYHSWCNGVYCVPAPDGGGAGGGDGTTDSGAPSGGGTTNDAGLPTDGGLDTYPDGGSLYSLWDGGSCAVMTDCPCFSSDQCGPGFVCQSQGSDFDVYCVPGQRGRGLVGADCTSEADCLSSLCIDSADGGKGCTALCGDDAECAPAVPSCNQFFALCTP